MNYPCGSMCPYCEAGDIEHGQDNKGKKWSFCHGCGRILNNKERV